MMKLFVIVFTLAFTAVFAPPRGCAEVQAVKKEELFSTKGTLTRVEAGEKMFFLKNEGGLELTFHTDAQTEMSGLGEGDFLEIDYFYNENYEKVARTIRKPEKSAAPA